MKLTFRYFALAVVGALMSGCAEEVEVVQPAVNGTVTMKTTISLDGKSATRALTEGGVKTFAAGDQIAVIYEQGTGTSKAVSVALTAADIDASDAHKATFSVALTNPKANGKVRYIYPASMAADDVTTTTPDNDATINYTALNTQDGTLTSLASTYDLAVYDGTMSATATLPTTASLTNPLTIGKFTIKNTTDADITNTITKLTIGDGTNTYTVNRTAAAGPIYVAMKPISSDQTIIVKATDGTTHYAKIVTGKTLAQNKIHPINVSMMVPAISFAESEKWWGSKDGTFTITVTNNADGVVTYSSSDPDVASVDPMTGEVTPGTVATATVVPVTITATVADSERATYTQKTAQYTLNVGGGYRYLMWDDTNKKLVYNFESPGSALDLIDSNTDAAMKLTSGGGVKFVKGTITILEDVTIGQDLLLILLDGAKLEINKQLRVNLPAVLSISAQSEGNDKGELVVKNNNGNAIDCYKDLNIYGGKITAEVTGTGKWHGISVSNSSSLKIYGGDVTANGSNNTNTTTPINNNGGGFGIIAATYIYGGTLSAVGGNSTNYLGGFGCQGDLYIHGGQATFFAGNGATGYTNNPACLSSLYYYGGSIMAIGDVTGNGIHSAIYNKSDASIVIYYNSDGSTTNFPGTFPLDANRNSALSIRSIKIE